MTEKTIAYDRQIYGKQARGGISRYFNLLADNIDRCPGVAKVQFKKSFLGAVDPSCDIIHATYYLGKPYSLLQGKLLVSTLHDLIPEKHPEYFFWSSVRSPHANKKRWLDSSDLIVSVSASSADDLAFYSPDNASRLIVIHHATVMGLIQPCPLADLAKRPFFLFVGKRQSYKNGMLLFRLLMLLKACGRSASDIPLIVFAGGERLSATENRLIASNSLESSLYFTVPSDSELAWLYRNAQAVLVPSIAEGFSFPVVEALACDAPVIASDIEVHREVGGSFASLLSPHNVHAWQDCILESAYSKPSMAMGGASYQGMLNHYSMQRFLSDHRAAYLDF